MSDETDLCLTFSRDGFDWCTDLGDEIGQNLFALGGYEAEEVQAVLHWARSNRAPNASSTVVDLGANIGTTTLPFARGGYRVLAFEPLPSTFKLLEKNVTGNGFSTTVSCVNRAVSHAAGTVEMWQTTGSGQSEIAVPGRDPSFVGRGYEPVAKVVVEADGLIGLLDGARTQVDDLALVWSDVQGSEADVIETGARAWAAGVPLYLEVDPVAANDDEGLAAFEALVERHFSTFIPVADLISGGSHAAGRPTKAFREFVSRIGRDSWSNALLIPF